MGDSIILDFCYMWERVWSLDRIDTLGNWEIFVFIVGNEKIFVDCWEDLLKIEHTCLPLRPNHHHHHSWDRSNPKLRFCNILWNPPFSQLVSGPGLQWGADALPFWCSSNLKFKQVSKWICKKCGNSSKTSHFNPSYFPPLFVFFPTFGVFLPTSVVFFSLLLFFSHSCCVFSHSCCVFPFSITVVGKIQHKCVFPPLLYFC